MSELLVDQARDGSERAFDDLVAPFRHELRVHCYRLLSSYDDADDAVQETLLRAWSRIATHAGTSTFRAWLYAIATNVCLDALRRRRRRVWPTGLTAASDPRGAIQPSVDLPWIQPYPDGLLSMGSAEDEAVRREGIELAFLAAIQLLPPRQRAVLILRDVLGWSAKEAAAALDMTSAAVNSALQRAHATLQTGALPDRDRSRVSSAEEQAVLKRFMAAWEAANPDAIANLLAEDARFVMPPHPTWFSGRANVLAFLFGEMEGVDGRHVGSGWRLMPTGANGQPAFGLYRQDGRDGVFMPFALGVLQVGAGGIEEISLFMDKLARFDVFGLLETV
jgi:RNA polymerase sigma-70 factor (ECF subfamily)